MKSSYKALFELTGKTAIVTGAVGILGQGFCRGLAEFGARWLSSTWIRSDVLRSPRIWSAITARLPSGSPAMLSDPASVANMVDEVVKRFGAINVLHNNAASKSNDLEAFFASTEKYSLSRMAENHVRQC